MSRFIIIKKLKKIINSIQYPLSKILQRKYINPLKDVKQGKKPLNIIFSLDKLNRFEIKNPKNKDPIIETIKLLFKNTLKKVAA